ncbi:MAG: beta-ketoacyl-[acyl-carrier-protein] synthase family protein [Candidatus Omnitrophica bacterium]|nr:beta-ketoacyl-[acyl-carrier-protein] synthase family protein [Candidatus Omnitrophota bacterium]
MSKRRVAITGLGLLTPCGRGWQPYWQDLLDSRSSIRRISSFQLNGFPSKYAGEILDFDPAVYIKQRKLLKVMSRDIQFSVGASQLAIEDAFLKLDQIDRSRFGISLGVGIINNDLDEIGVGIRSGLDGQGQFQMDKFGQDGIRALFPLWFLKYLPNMPACHISIAHGLHGPSNTITTSSAASTQAIGEAFLTIQRGDADLMLAGGADSKINAMGISRFHMLGLLSQSGSAAADFSYCPFDKRHDGMVLGEGSGLLVIEELEHARKRGAKIYGEIVGYGSSSDFNYDPRSIEDFNGKKLAMTRALHNAEMEPREIDFLMANGSGIPSEDIQEARAVESVFQDAVQDLKITATKPITGHLVYGAGGVEMAGALLALDRGIIPPIAHFESPDPECDLPFVKSRPQSEELDSFLFNSFGFGGQNASLAVRKAQS